MSLAAARAAALLLLLAADVVWCKYVFDANIGGWMKAHKFVATWEEAFIKCRSEDALLMSPTSKELALAMRAAVSSTELPTAYYIGTSAAFYPGDQYLSIEGIPLDDMPVSDMIDRLDARDGKCLSMDRERIRVVPCTSRLPYICYRKQKDNNSNRNETEYEPYDDEYKLEASTGSCYKYHAVERTWHDAYLTCADEGAHLVVINDEREARAIHALGLPTSGYMFIGIRDWKDDHDWLSVHGESLESLYAEWHDGHEDEVTGELCGVLDGLAKLNHFRCDDERHFLCEKPPKSARLLPPREEQAQARYNRF
ncbi:uncharacterized protein LOC142986411 [Anticarsia gemmatalis]|uniref:uncharacterized protein LOC142986411 n=1 Tax=Anticarsia gemmatalis TaxID=129554 RepID=UPI003F768A47